MPEQNPTWRIISTSYLGPHPYPLGLQQLSLLLQRGQPVCQLGLDTRDGALHPFGPGDVMCGRKDSHLTHLLHHLPGERVQVVQ